jgi:hypothetical protein
MAFMLVKNDSFWEGLIAIFGLISVFRGGVKIRSRTRFGIATPTGSTRAGKLSHQLFRGTKFPNSVMKQDPVQSMMLPFGKSSNFSPGYRAERFLGRG